MTSKGRFEGVVFQAKSQGEFKLLEDRLGTFCEHYTIRGDRPIIVSPIEESGIRIAAPNGGKIFGVVPVVENPKGTLTHAASDYVELKIDEVKYFVSYKP